MKLLRLFFMAFMTTSLIHADNETVTFGAIADCQYKDVEGKGVRKYNKSLKKLKDAVENINQQQPDFVIHLGDLIDADIKSFSAVLPILKESSVPLYHVLGNHDFDVEDSEKSKIPQLMGLKSRYYDFEKKNWRFIVLDGNALSLYAWKKESKEHQNSQAYYDSLTVKQPTYNGGVDKEQLVWLEKTLKKSERDKEKVIIFCHFPVLPKEHHILWNSDEVIGLIEKYSCIKAYMNGHNHHGNYQQKEGIHYITFKGMVDTDENAFATVKLTEKNIEISGFDREESRKLPIR